MTRSRKTTRARTRSRKTTRPRKTARPRKTKRSRKTIGGGLTPDPDFEYEVPFNDDLIPTITITEEQEPKPTPIPTRKTKTTPLSNLLVDRSKNLGKMLSVICKDPDNCLAIGPYSQMVKTYFEDFRNLSFINVAGIKRLGNPSSNGFVFEFPFKKNEYTAYTVLKSAAKSSADNLFYEYYVGKTFINKYLNKFPIFVETYDCYRYKDLREAITFYQIANKNTTFDYVGITDLSKSISRVNHGDLNSLEEIKKLFKESCRSSDTICILIQHFNNLTSFRDLFDNASPNYQNNKFDGPFLFYQLYFTLSVLGNKYTHYDLHSDNVCVYKPYAGNNYILMRYHSKGTVYEFPSEYIVKVIDYGRNYINNGTVSTKQIMDIICDAPTCQPNCGFKQGYSTIQGDTDFYDINPIEPNVSHDLRVFANLNDNIKPDFWKGKIYKDTFYYKTHYGTPESLIGDYANVKSVHDLRAALETTAFPIYKPDIVSKYATWTKVAEMDVYDDGRDYEYKVI
jgi:hypothetical protein